MSKKAAKGGSRPLPLLLALSVRIAPSPEVTLDLRHNNQTNNTG